MKRSDVQFAGTILLMGLILVAAGAFMTKGCSKQPDASAPVNLNRHPIYSTYKFPKDENIIHMGIQPLWIFEGNIAEAMTRDGILPKKLGELGLRISFHRFLKGADTNFFVRQGDLHGGMCGDMPTLAIAASVDVVIPASVNQSYDSIITNRPMLVKDLKGKRIAYPEGSVSHRALLEALDSEGLSRRQVELVPMDVTEMPEALHTGFIDAFAAWEPTASTTLTRYPGTVAIHRSRHLGFMYFRKDFADAHPEAVRQIVAAEIRAIRWLRSDRSHLDRSSMWVLQGGKELSAPGWEASPEQLSEIIADLGGVSMVPIIPKGDVKPDGLLHREFQFLKASRQIPASAAWEKVLKMFDRRTTREVLAHPAEYLLDTFDYGTTGH